MMQEFVNDYWDLRDSIPFILALCIVNHREKFGRRFCIQIYKRISSLPAFQRARMQCVAERALIPV